MKHITFIIMCCLILGSCTKMEIIPVPEMPKDIFQSTETVVSDAQDLTFTLNSEGVFVLKLVDVSTGQVISKEKITGLAGKNNIKIYTKSITTEYLYLVLEDETRTEIKRTKLKIN